MLPVGHPAIASLKHGHIGPPWLPMHDPLGVGPSTIFMPTHLCSDARVLGRQGQL